MAQEITSLRAEELLEKIVEHNRKLIQEADGEPSRADLYTVKYEEYSIWNPFFEETIRSMVNPLDYYGAERLTELISEFTGEEVIITE